MGVDQPRGEHPPPGPLSTAGVSVEHSGARTDRGDPVAIDSDCAVPHRSCSDR
jgi:hypothetical protein